MVRAELSGDFAARQCKYFWQVMVDIWHYGDAQWGKVVPLGSPHAMYGLHWACCPLALAAPAPTLADARSGRVGLES